MQFSLRGKDYDYDLTPDGEPFGINYTNGTYRFCVFETDCASEPLSASTADRQSHPAEIRGLPHRPGKRPLREPLGLSRLDRAFHHDHEAPYEEHDRASCLNDRRQETACLLWLHHLQDHPSGQSAGQRMGREAVGTRPRNPQPRRMTMDRLQRIKDLVEQKTRIDQELADLKSAVKAERAAFALQPRKPRRKSRGASPLESNKQSPIRGALSLTYCASSSVANKASCRLQRVAKVAMERRNSW